MKGQMAKDDILQNPSFHLLHMRNAKEADAALLHTPCDLLWDAWQP